MTPNIDEAGARARLNGSRIILVLAALMLIVPGIPQWLALTFFGVLVAAGLFMRFEAKKRWCVLRSCGIRTKI